ncbi:MAG TPA: M20/M25/M40 family metallo-hydrolase [Thermomicrobiales bacterium]|nr:M20/M25/M40 family metallo-hydrolase [Thermomicrobiales bacterium]
MTAALAAATRRAILDTARRLQPDLTALLRELVRTPSVNPALPGADGAAGEGRVQELVAAELARLGARLDVWEPNGAALAARYPVLRAMSTADYRGRPNVVGVLGDAGDLRLILNSHADTVAADRARWRRDPFGGEVEDGWLYGLGAADAKGSLVAYLGALRVLREAGVRLAGGVALTSVVDEEAGGGGTLACIVRGYRAPGALVGEPTSFAVCPGSRGAFGLAVTVVGRSAHLGVAYQGVNAIEQALPYLQAFAQLGRDLDRAYLHPLWAPLPAGHVLSVTGIAADTAPGTVPARCSFRCSVGYTAGEREADVLARVEAAFAAVTAADPWLRAHPPTIEAVMPSFAPAAAEADHPLVGALLLAAGDLGLAVPPVEALSAATDGRWLTNDGGTPAINFGPGDMRRGHSPDEALRLDDFHRAVAWVALAVARYCGGA